MMVKYSVFDNNISSRWDEKWKLTGLRGTGIKAGMIAGSVLAGSVIASSLSIGMMSAGLPRFELLELGFAMYSASKVFSALNDAYGNRIEKNQDKFLDERAEKFLKLYPDSRCTKEELKSLDKKLMQENCPDLMNMVSILKETSWNKFYGDKDDLYELSIDIKRGGRDAGIKKINELNYLLADTRIVYENNKKWNVSERDIRLDFMKPIFEAEKNFPSEEQMYLNEKSSLFNFLKENSYEISPDTVPCFRYSAARLVNSINIFNNDVQQTITFNKKDASVLISEDKSVQVLFGKTWYNMKDGEVKQNGDEYTVKFSPKQCSKQVVHGDSVYKTRDNYSPSYMVFNDLIKDLEKIKARPQPKKIHMDFNQSLLKSKNR